MATIFTFNVLAVLLFPGLGHLMGLSQESFGIWAGTAVNDTSSVVAAATVYGAAATSMAVVVKLTRTLMIIPISVGLAVAQQRRERRLARLCSERVEHRLADGDAASTTEDGRPSGERDDRRLGWRSFVPAFLLLFIVAAAVNSLGIIPSSWHDGIAWTATYFITVALTAVGLSTSFAALRQAGWRPLALGGILWVAVAVSSLGLQGLTGHL